MSNEGEDNFSEIDDFLRSMPTFQGAQMGLFTSDDLFSELHSNSSPNMRAIHAADYSRNEDKHTGTSDNPLFTSTIHELENCSPTEIERIAGQAAASMLAVSNNNLTEGNDQKQDENSSLDLSVESDDFDNSEKGEGNERAVQKPDKTCTNVLRDVADGHMDQSAIGVAPLAQRPHATLGRELVNKKQRKKAVRKKKGCADRTLVFSKSELSAIEIDAVRSLPSIEETVANTQKKDSPVENIIFEVFENDSRSVFLERLLSFSKPVRQHNQDNLSLGLFAVRDEDMFFVLYEMMKSRILHRQEAFHAAFVSYIMQESMAEKDCSSFFLRFIMSIEAVTSRTNVQQLATAILPSPADDALERARKAANNSFRDEVAKFDETNFISLTTSMIDDSEMHLAEIRARKKGLHSIGAEFKRMRRALDEKGMPYKYIRLPSRKTSVEKKSSVLTARRGELVHLIAWYLNELFLCGDVTVHFVYARMLVKAIIIHTTEEFYADRVGQSGDLLKRLFYDYLVQRIETLGDLIVHEMTNERDMRIQAFMWMIRSNFSEPDRSLVLSFDETKVPELEGISIGNPLVPDHGVRLGPLLVSKLESDIQYQNWSLSFLNKRELNVGSVRRAYDRYLAPLGSSGNFYHHGE